MIWRASLLALGCWACCGCSETTPTEVIVQLYVEPALAAKATTLKVSVENDDKVLVVDKTTALDGTAGRIARIPLIPKGDNPTRRFIVHAELGDGTNVLGRIEARAGYSDGELRTLNLWFSNACETDCGDGRTCDHGTCRGACFETSSAEATEPSRPSCKECQTCLVGCEATDKAPCGCTGDFCAGSDCKPKDEARFVAAGWTHSCAVLTDDVVRCWGTLDQLGLSVAAPTVTSANGNAGVSVGIHGCSVSETTPAASPMRTCWGPNGLGQLGNGATDEPSVVTLANADPQIRRVDVGKHHTCGLGLNGEVACWGENASGQIGNGNFDLAAAPTVIGTGYAQIAVGGDQSCARENSGTLRCWGNNYSGQVGVNDRTAIVTPVEPGCDDPASPTCFHDWTFVGAGNWVTCGIRDGGKLYCWGTNVFGERGTGGQLDTSEISEPTRVGAAITWSQVEGGFRHTCGIDSANRLYCWGNNHEHEVSESGTPAVATPVRVDTDVPSGFRSVSLGQFHTCAIREDRTVWCWGRNVEGQIGANPGSEVVERPTRVCF